MSRRTPLLVWTGDTAQGADGRRYVVEQVWAGDWMASCETPDGHTACRYGLSQAGAWMWCADWESVQTAPEHRRGEMRERLGVREAAS